MSAKRRVTDSTNSPDAKRQKTSFPPTLVLIEYDRSTKRYSVPAEVKQFLHSLGTAKIAPVVTGGPYRSGKSHLQNAIILKVPKERGFVVGDTVNACTKGLHISTHVLDGDSATDGAYKILVIDTEGLNDVHATETEDARIFSLALLLSSLFIYNCKNTIDQSALSNLNMVAHISEHIRVTASSSSLSSSSSSSAATDELVKFFPSLLWIVRDFSLDLVDHNNVSIEQAEYLERALEPIPGVDPGKNEVRNSIRRYFPQRDCVTLVRPVADEKLIKNMSSLPESAFRPEFVAQAASLRRKIMQMARPKQMCGTYVTGPLLARLAEDYCQAFNQGRAPAIKDSWSLISANECQEAGTAAIAAFDAHLRLRKITPDATEPFSSQELEAIIIESFKTAKETYNRTAIGEQAGPYLEKLSDALRVKADNVRRQNREIVAGLATEAVTELDQSLMGFADFDAFLAELFETRKRFVAQWGADKQTAFDAELITRIRGWVAQFHAKLYETESVARQTHGLLQARLDLAEKQAARFEADAARAAKALEESESAVKAAAAETADVTRRRDALQQALNAAESSLTAMDERHRATLQGLQTQVSDLQVQVSDRQTRLLETSTALSDAQTVHAELAAALTAARQELELLRPLSDELDRLRAQVPGLEQQLQLKQTSIDDLNERLEAEARERQTELDALQKQSRDTIASVRKLSQDLKIKAAQLEQTVRQHTATIKDLRAEQTRLTSDLELATKDRERLARELETAAQEFKGKLTKLKTEEAERARDTQAKAEEMSRQFQLESKQAQQKAQQEYEALFARNMETSREMQSQKARADQHEMLQQRAEELLNQERQKFKDGNYQDRITQLEKQLASEKMRSEMLAAEKDRKSNQTSEDQARIRDLEAKLRTIEQRHRSQVMALELDRERLLAERGEEK